VPKFRYAAVDAEGKKVRGSLDAPDETSARLALLERELEIAKLDERRNPNQIELTTQKLKPDQTMLFSRQLAAFVRSGIPIIQAIDLLAAEQKKLFGRILRDVADRLRRGETLSDAVAVHAARFPPYFVPMLRSAELSGNLDTVLDRLSDYIERDLTTRRAIKSALVYPSVILVMSMATVVLLVAFVLPKFEKFFSQLGAKLPFFTRLLLSIARFFESWWTVVAAGVAGVVALVWLVGRTKRGRYARDALLLKLPAIGKVARYVAVERFCRVLSAMIASGVSVAAAMNAAADGAHNRVFRRALYAARDEMLEGNGIARPVVDTGLFPDAAGHMLLVGETTGTMDAQLRTAADYYEQEVLHRVKRLTTLFEPAVIVVMGGIVGFVAIALVQAMYGAFQSGTLH
jgi:type IV pilus assembly protein PilC